MADLIPVLLVEDERLILDDILSMIDWEAEGFRVAATATNGKLGCAAYQQFRPQLVITDIQMPVMDGLAMMRQLRQEDSSVSFLILSSYSEFEYAKEAVRLGSDSYLLKTELSPELLRETLAPIREKIVSRRSIHRITSQHKLFSLLTSSVEPSGAPAPTRREVTEAYRAYLEAAPDPEERRRQLQWLVRECYAVLGSSGRATPLTTADPEETERWLLEEYDKLCSLYQFICVKKYSPIIINACQFIQENCSDHQLRIGLAAEHVGLSASRLSVLFKQELGRTVNDYITEVRMEKAKELLRSGRYKVYEVSDIVGYSTSQYFSQIFFQYAGCSPTDYLRGHVT